MQHCFTQVVDTNSVDTNQLASSSQLVWIYTVCKGSLYPGSVGPGLIHCHFLLQKMYLKVSVHNFLHVYTLYYHTVACRPRWLSWMRCPTGDQEVAGSTPAKVGNILSWRLIMKYFLWSFSPFCWFKKGSCQFLAKECAQYWLTA